MTFPARVRIVEVGPRDGLQNEAAIVPLDAKVALVDALAGAGLVPVEAGSFVSPKWVPQMADTAEVLARSDRRPGTAYPVLTPNLQGLDRALACGVREIAVFGAASESFSRRSINPRGGLECHPENRKSDKRRPAFRNDRVSAEG